MSEQEIRKILAIKLKEFRERAGLTAKEAGLALGKSEKTINAWEHERGQPDADMLFHICKLYGITNISVFYGLNSESVLSSSESELLTLYRQLNEKGQAHVLDTARIAAGNPEMQKENTSSAMA